ncbi:MAG: Gfo/Idh/MocA family oxidoreductase [Gammaproteobacteria bacterium]|nr:Gfo/Idh/MocA family oxidoreductase [Gammaproteobacteria bacterium]
MIEELAYPMGPAVKPRDDGNSKKLRCAVIGVGHMGQFHAEKLACLQEIEFVGVCDIHAHRTKQIAKKHKTTAFADYHALLPIVDAVSIAVPTKDHYAIARPFLEKGIHVLLEKPIATTTKQADHLIKIAEKNHCILHIGHIEHFNAAWEAAKPYLTKPLFLEAHRLSPFKPRNMDVDVILDLMIHDLEMIQHLVPSTLKSIQAMGAPILTQKTDIANVRLQFHNGCVANLIASRVSMKAERILRIFQKESYVHINFSDSRILVYQKSKIRKKPSPLTQTVIQIPPQDALLLEIKAFINSILHGQSRDATQGKAGKNALALALRVERMLQPPTTNH